MSSVMSIMNISPIDCNSPLPYYIQIKYILKELVSNGKLKYGDQLPGEPILCQIFSVSRTVVRQALNELENEGFVLRKRGIGTFISEPKAIERLTENLTGFYQDMKVRGLKPFTRMLDQKLIPADSFVASQLQINPGTPVVRLNRLRYINNEPIVLTDTYIPDHLVPGLDNMELSRSSLYEVLEHQYGLVLTRGYRIIGAATASGYQAELFQIQPGDPLIVIKNITYTADGTPVEFYSGLYRGDRNIFEVEMIRQK